ncbi:hypothetical protein C8A03DRAFT_35271 [Achaetomium macrosporum]|uniref:PLL-like beta propeller domain-containing protein n=1 Tax=Achaetomium macrosporum TaxID=79813 RepID=A0AAN7HE47_9PEZI|nr:hypothetical protein C8A03DRAFT_35271 [Achaetomium macrosporum]
MRTHLIVFAAFSSLVISAPQRNNHPFLPEPRAGPPDWNTPRDHGEFLAKRLNLHTESYFNNPPVKRSPVAGGSGQPPSVTPSLTRRATANQWENLEGNAMWHPSPVSWGGSRMDVYYADKNNRTCKHRSRDGGKWSSGWEDLGGSLDSAPAACSRKPDNMHVFCKGTDGQCWHRSYDGGRWGGWQSIGGSMKHYPSTCSWGRDHVGVWVSAPDGQCWHRRYDEAHGGWYSWENLGGSLDGPPKAVTWGAGHASVFCKGQDGQAWHRKYDRESSGGWGEWESLGGSLDAEPAACAWDGRMDVFVRGTDGACWHKTYKRQTGWGGWENMGGKLKPGRAPDVVAYRGKMEVYITSDDNAVYRRVWENDKWTAAWEYMGGDVDTKPNALAWDDGKVDVYGAGRDGSCRRCY